MSMGNPVYLDTSALVKLVIPEPESAALNQFMDDPSAQMVSSEISEIELVRAVRRKNDLKYDRALELLAQTVLLPATSSMRLRASYLAPLSVRSLVAIHIATALEIQTDLDCLVAYDRQLLESASAAGLRVMSPGMASDG